MEMTCSFRRRRVYRGHWGQGSGHPVSHIQGLVQPLHPPLYACPVTQATSNRSPAAFSEIREYFKLRGGDFQPVAALKTRICNSETIVEFKKRRVGGLLRGGSLSI